jgi:flagellar basal body-associated protein FliL
MPRASTLIILLSTVVLLALGFAAAVPVGIALALTFELVARQQAAERERAQRLARVARPVRRMHGRR